MRIYLIGKHENATADRVRQIESKFADFSAVGTWVDDGSRCDACGWHGQSLSEPLLVQWEPGVDAVGDFSWDGPFGYVALITDRVVAFFHTHDFRCDLLSVKYVPPEPCGNEFVSYPYTGPKQHWVKCTSIVDLDTDGSKVEVKLSCGECGRVKYTFRNQGIVIPKRNWHGEKIFRITTNGRSLATFVTEEARCEIEENAFTNIAFSLAGEIVD